MRRKFGIITINGYVVANAMFDREEISLLQRAAKEDRELDQHSFSKQDGEGERFGSRCGTIPATRCTECSRAASRW